MCNGTVTYPLSPGRTGLAKKCKEISARRPSGGSLPPRRVRHARSVQAGCHGRRLRLPTVGRISPAGPVTKERVDDSSGCLGLPACKGT